MQLKKSATAEHSLHVTLGCRSLIAVDALHGAGYTQLAWLAGGLNDARDGDFASVGGETKLQFATAGGVQGLLLKLGQYIATFQQSGKA